MDFFAASKFRDRFYRPDVVSLVLKTLDEKEAVQQGAPAESQAPKPEAEERLYRCHADLSPFEAA